MQPVEWPSVADARRIGFSGAWHVDSAYRIHEGLIEPVPQLVPPARVYAPITHSELPNVLAKLHDGTDDDVLRFVGSYGLLGFSELASRDTEKTQRHGDPLRWVRQHALNVRLIMSLWKLVQDADEGGLQRELAELSGPHVTVRLAAGATITRKRFMLGVAHPEPGPFALARLIVLSLINPNLAGIGPVLSEAGTGIQLGFTFRALLEVIYYQLAKAITGRRMERCAAKDCGGLFIQQDPRQRFCPLWLGVKGESLCSLRERQRTWRERQPSRSMRKRARRRQDGVEARSTQEGRKEQTGKPSQQRTATKGGRHSDTIKRT